MSLDRAAWRRQLHLSNFVNAAYQFRDVESLAAGNKLLIIGPGQGLDTALFRWREYQVTTFDIDATFAPDVIGSCHQMGMFQDRQFDVVIASHVLEHLPVALLPDALAELARVARYALVYLPMAGRHCTLRLIPGMFGLDLSLTFDLAAFWEKPDGLSPRYRDGQHYWEIGLRGYRWRDVERMLSGQFRIVRSYRNLDWLESGNFVLQSRRWTA
jgi:hypothetical protein